MKQIQQQLKQKEEEVRANEEHGKILKEELRKLQNAAQHFAPLLADQGTKQKLKEEVPTETTSTSTKTEKEQRSTTTTSTNSKKWYELVEEESEPSPESIAATSTNCKKWYVIFDGPFKGVYNDWGIVNSHITGKNVTHKSYKTKEAAQEAYKAAYKTIVKEEVQKSSKMTSLNTKINSLNHHNNIKISEILSTREKEELKKETIQKFERLWSNLIDYNTLGFYPVQRRSCPKAIILPRAEPLTVWDYFSHGLIDTLYINGETLKEIQEFPNRMQQAIKNYKKRFAKGRQLFIKLYSSYTIFDDNQQVLVPSIALGYFGVSNNDYPTRNELPDVPPTN